MAFDGRVPYKAGGVYSQNINVKVPPKYLLHDVRNCMWWLALTIDILDIH